MMVGDRDFRHYATDLRAYAQRLKRILQTLGKLADSGVATSRQHHVPMALRPFATRGWVNSDEALGSFDTARGLPLSHEHRLLDEWCSEAWGAPERHPLLILGPLGSGKSVVLESFAYRLADVLERWAATPDATKLPPIPLPVRLRALRYADGEAERFGEFLVRSQEVIDPNDKAGLLSATVLGDLLDAGNVVCLLDGLDELPGPTEFGDIRRRVLDAASAVCGDFYVLTSRHGYGAERRIGREYQHELQPLDDATAVEFIRSRLGVSAQHAHPAIRVFDCYSAQMRAALARPVFLAAWCERVADDPANPPRNHSEVMLEVYLRCFDHRRRSLRLNREELFAARPRLGALLKVFADSGFNTRTSDELRSALARESEGTAAAFTGVIELSLDMDLLTQVGRSSYMANGSGPTEYLVARYLAELVSLSGERVRHFVHTFQRWVWNPHLHGLLESTLILLSDGTERSEWPAALVDWLSALGSHPHVPDDLLHPMAAFGLRLASLIDGPGAPDDSACERYVDALAPSVNVSSPLATFAPLDYGSWLDTLLPRTLPVSLADALMTETIGRLCRTESPLEQQQWETVRDALGMRVRSDEAAELAEHWSRRAANDQEHRSSWQAAAAMAAGRIPEASAVATMRRWLRLAPGDVCTHEVPLLVGGAASRVPAMCAGDEIQRLLERQAEAADDANRQLLVIAIARLAPRLDARDAPPVVERLVAEYAADAAASRRDLWLISIDAAASRIDPEHSISCVKRWIARLSMATNERERPGWLTAITEGSARALPGHAGELVEHLVERLDATRSDAEQRRWGWAAQCASERIAAGDAGRLVKKWVAECKTADSDTEDMWRDAIAGAAARVRPQDSSALVRWLLREWAATTKATMREWLPSVVVAAASRVQHEDAQALLKRFVSLEASATTQFLADRWSVAALTVASRMSESDALDWVERCADAKGSSTVAWLIPSIAGCVSEADAPALIQEWADRLVQPGSQQQPWRGALQAALGRVDEASAVVLCRRLAAAGFIEETITLAERVGTVALVRRSPRDAARRVGAQSIEVRDRHDGDLIFDARGDLAPPLVRNVLGSGAATGEAASGEDTYEESVAGRAEANDNAMSQQAAPTRADTRLKSRELRVLEYIRSCEDSGMDPPNQNDIGSYIHRSSDAARLVCIRLEKAAGLIHRPDGARSGYLLTDAGRAFFRRRADASE